MPILLMRSPYLFKHVSSCKISMRTAHLRWDEAEDPKTNAPSMAHGVDGDELFMDYMELVDSAQGAHVEPCEKQGYSEVTCRNGFVRFVVQAFLSARFHE